MMNELILCDGCVELWLIHFIYPEFVFYLNLFLSDVYFLN